MKKRFIFLSMVLLPMLASADEWQDPETRVNYTYNPNGTTAEVKAGPNPYNGSPQATGNITILSEIIVKGNKYRVTSIGKCAFIYSNITSVAIPNSITEIQDDAFNGCTQLISVNIPNSVTSIGLCAFYGCALPEITIPESVSHIDVAVFGECGCLESIIVDKKNKYYDSRNDCNAIIRTADNTLMRGGKKTVIPNSVTVIDNFAFSGTVGLTSIDIPNSVIRIGNWAFGRCYDLINIYCKATTPPALVSDGSSPFSGTSLQKITLHVPLSSIESYKTTSPWSNFDKIVALEENESEQEPDPQKCATPTIAFKDGKLSFDCETEGATVVYSFKSSSADKVEGNNVNLPSTFTVSVYAKKDGYLDSETVTEEIDVRGMKGDMNDDGTLSVTDVGILITTILQAP